MKVLLTSTSFQDCVGSHKELLNEQRWEVSYLRGPLKKSEIIDKVADFDALICGDDELDREVIKKGVEGRLKYISKLVKKCLYAQVGVIKRLRAQILVKMGLKRSKGLKQGLKGV